MFSFVLQVLKNCRREKRLRTFLAQTMGGLSGRWWVGRFLCTEVVMILCKLCRIVLFWSVEKRWFLGIAFYKIWGYITRYLLFLVFGRLSKQPMRPVAECLIPLLSLMLSYLVLITYPTSGLMVVKLTQHRASWLPPVRPRAWCSSGCLVLRPTCEAQDLLMVLPVHFYFYYYM